MHFTGVLGTGAWAVVYVTQVYVYTKVHICQHTLFTPKYTSANTYMLALHTPCSGALVSGGASLVDPCQ